MFLILRDASLNETFRDKSEREKLFSTQVMILKRENYTNNYA